MAYVLQGVVGGRGYGVFGLGSDAKKDQMNIARLRTQVANGQPGAQQALDEALRLQPAQNVWDLKAAALRAAGQDQINSLPQAARKTAQAALESTIVHTIGPRPEGHTPQYWAMQSSGGGSSGGGSSGGGFMDFLTGKSDIEIGGKKVSSTGLFVGALVIGGAIYALTK